MSGYKHTGLTEEEYYDREAIYRVIEIINKQEDAEPLFIEVLQRLMPERIIELYRAMRDIGY